MKRFCVVEASAGTGKTYFLEHRVVALLLEEGATIDQILLVTFTEKATAELRTRIRDKLSELAPTEKKLREALTAFDRGAISTIHGFCQRLLVEDAFSGRRLFDQVQVPDEAAFAEAFHLTLREQIAVDPDLCRVLGAYLDTGGSIEALRDLLLRCARAGAPVTPELDPVRLEEAVVGLRRAAAAELVRGFVKLAANSRKAIVARLETIVAAFEGDADPIARSVALDGCLDDIGWILERPQHLAGAPAIQAALAELAAAHASVAAIATSRFLPHVLGRVRATKSRRGQFDFQDMLRLVWDVLEGDRGAELAARLRKRHPWAMIDEFQDTDELQWKIFDRVWGQGEATRLTIVGDPKQAIYSFRGADVQTYLRAKRELIDRGAEVIALTDNYRSSPDVVDAVNELIDGTFFTGGIRYDQPVRAASQVALLAPGGAPPPPVQLIEIVPDGDRRLTSDLLTQTIAEAFAEEIAALLAPAPPRRLQIRDRRGAVAPLAPHDIHVLTRSGAQSDVVAKALRARGVPCALYQREHLFESAEALEVADLLAAIAEPRDRSARLRAWTTSFFAVPLQDLERLLDVPDGHPLATLLHDWRGLGLRKQWDELFHRVLEDTRWVERTLIAGGGERAVTNVLHLFELLHDDLARAPAELHELEARLRGWIRTGQIDRPDDVDIQRLETDRQAVQIMTIHRAKGLEAAVVLVCGGHWPVGDRDLARLFHDDDGRRWLHVGDALPARAERIDADVIAENERLMYVAITRAKARLYLPVFPEFTLHERAPCAPLHRRLQWVLGARATDPDAARLFAHTRVTAGSLAPPDPAESAEHLAGWTPPPAPPEPAAPWDRIRAARGGIVVTSYSRLKHAAARASDRDDARGEEHSAAVTVGAEDLPAGAATGLFLHEVLEHVPFASADEEPAWDAWAMRGDVAPCLEAAARHHGIGEGHRAVGARLVHQALRAPVQVGGATLGTLARAPRVAREVEFTYPLALPDGRAAFARGYVDLLVAWDDRLWVVDYKSDVIDDPAIAASRRHVDAHYAQQSRLYAVAAARLLGLAGEADCARRFGGVLYWFLRSGHVVDLPVAWADVARWTDELARDVVRAEEAP